MSDTQEKTTPTQDGQQSQVDGQTDKAESKTDVTTTEEFRKMQKSLEARRVEAERKAERASKEAESANSAMATLQRQIATLQSQVDEAEFSQLRELPNGEKIIAVRQQIRQKELELAKRETDIAKVQRDAYEGLKFRDALSMSKEYGIEVEDLMSCESYDQMKDKVIAYLKENKTKDVPKVEKVEKKEAILPTHVDSGIQTTSGKGRIWKASEISNMSKDKRFELRSEIAKATQEGRIRMNE